MPHYNTLNPNNSFTGKDWEQGYVQRADNNVGYLTKRIVTLYKRERITVKVELSFQLAICYLSFRGGNI